MKTITFASRNGKEMLRDPLNLSFGIGFPIVLLLLLTAIQANIPAKVSLFKIESLAPGIAVFGLSFISLFSGMLIAKDRSTSFLMRLFASPMTSSNFIFGYVLPLLPMAVVQCAALFIFSFFLGLKFNLNVLLTLVVLIPAAMLFIGFGLLAGSIFTDKQVGGVCGAILTNVSAWLSGTWFDLNLVGGSFKAVAKALPFVHAVDAAKASMAGNYSAVFPDLWWVIGYAAVIMAVAVFAFYKKMNSDNV